MATDLNQSAWRLSINPAHDGEAKYASVYAGDRFVGNLRIHHASAIVEAMNRRAAATSKAAPRTLDALMGLTGLIEMIVHRSDISDHIRQVLLNNHRMEEALAVISASTKPDRELQSGECDERHHKRGSEPRQR